MEQKSSIGRMSTSKTDKVLSVAALSLVLLAGTSDSAIAGSNKGYTPFLTRGSTTFEVDGGIKYNKFDWNIASDMSGEATPDILSELTWDSIKVFESTAKLRHLQPVGMPIVGGAVMLEAEIKAGLTTGGENQDSDYNGDGRTDEFSRSNNNADGGYTLGWDAAIGYQFDITPSSVRKKSPQTYLMITPLIGYGWDRQKYEMTDGNQTIPAYGSFDGLDSEYQAEWRGPFVGLEAEYQKNKHLFRLRGELQDLEYDAEAVWNLRTDFMQDPSYTHKGDGDGYRIDAEYAYAFSPNYVFTIKGAYEERTMDENGIDTTFFSDGTVMTTRLNEVNDESGEFKLGVRYHW